MFTKAHTTTFLDPAILVQSLPSQPASQEFPLQQEEKYVRGNRFCLEHTHHVQSALV
jgi:hypothetical protein